MKMTTGFEILLQGTGGFLWKGQCGDGVGRRSLREAKKLLAKASSGAALRTAALR